MILAIIQARMSSTRLYGKVLADIVGQPMLWHVVNRVSRAQRVDKVVVATSTEVSDNPIAELCQQESFLCFRGSEGDVLDRFYQTAKHFSADAIVRITSDCPLIDPDVIDKVVSLYIEDSTYDYVTNTLRYTYPDGLDTEVISFKALARAWRESKRPIEREHVTLFVRNSGLFRVVNVENDIDLAQETHRWVVDRPLDLKFVRQVYTQLNRDGKNLFGMQEVLALLSEHPEILAINQSLIQNEGAYLSILGEPPLPPQPRDLSCSEELKRKAERLIPSCSQTFSKSPTQFVQGVAPVFLSRGKGSHVWDVDGNEYIDYPMSLGPIILGHNYPAVTKAVRRQIQDGTIFSLPHPLEVEVAEILVDIIPCAEMVRYGKNGSDVTAGAIRVARAYTGRDIVACCGYHGWQDWFIGTTTRSKGIPEAIKALTLPFEYNNVASLERIFAEHADQVAAVIMEPVGFVEPQDGFLQKVCDLTERQGAVLIFDEVITGFRLALGGAQEYFGTTPDLACFGKAMGNGYPIAAVVGRREIMELFDEVFFSFTFGGETLSLAAAKATITELQAKNVIAHLWEHGRRLKDGYNVLVREYGIDQYTQCVGFLPRTSINFWDESNADPLIIKSLFQQECLKRGVLIAGSHNLCYSHSHADIEHTLRVYRSTLEICAEAIKAGNVSERLEGKSVQPVFRRA